jgi:hypothetical protein
MILVVVGENSNTYRAVMREVKDTGKSEEFVADGRIILK